MFQARTSNRDRVSRHEAHEGVEVHVHGTAAGMARELQMWVAACMRIAHASNEVHQSAEVLVDPFIGSTPIGDEHDFGEMAFTRSQKRVVSSVR